MTALGIGLILTTLSFLVRRFWRADRAAVFPAHGWVGVGISVAAAILIAWGVMWVKVFLTPIVWTGYVLAMDAAVFRVRGRSMLISAPGAFLWMAVLSIPLWLLFEAYNLRLQNWRYVGLPDNIVLRAVGYLWSFATIWPAVLETTEFLLVTGEGKAAESRNFDRSWTFLGAVMLLVPLVVPVAWGAYLFGFVWLGFALLLDPGRVWGDRVLLRALCGAGMVCGFVWEFWNYWAAARWVYVFPIWQDWKIFEMPVPGYLGFPAFAVEVFAMYFFVTRVLRLPYYEVS